VTCGLINGEKKPDYGFFGFFLNKKKKAKCSFYFLFQRKSKVVNFPYGKLINPASLGYLKMFTGCNSVKTFFGCIL
jgi:hypothetical protein